MNSLKIRLKYIPYHLIITNLNSATILSEDKSMNNQQQNDKNSIHLTLHKDLISKSAVSQDKLAKDIDEEYRIPNADSFIIAQYGFLRNIWATHFKQSLCQNDNCEDRIDRINKIVAMMKGRITNRSQKQFQMSQNARNCIFSGQLFVQKSEQKGNVNINSDLQGQLSRIATQYIFQNPLYRKMKQQLQRSQMQRQSLLQQIQKIQKQKSNIQRINLKNQNEKSKLNKKIKQLTKKVIELGMKNVELEDQLLFNDTYGLGIRTLNSSQSPDEVDLAQSIVLENNQNGQQRSLGNPELKNNQTKRSLIFQFEQTKPNIEKISNSRQKSQQKTVKQSKSAKILHKQQIKQIKKRIQRSPSDKSFRKQINEQGNCSYMCYSIKASQVPSQQTSLNNLSLIQLQRQQNQFSDHNNLQVSFPAEKQAHEIIFDEIQHQKQTQDSISQYYTVNGQARMVSSGSKLSISKNSGQSMKLRFSRKASASKIRFGITPRDRNCQLNLQQSQKESQLRIQKSLKDPQVYKQNQFYTKFTKLKAMKIRRQ